VLEVFITIHKLKVSHIQNALSTPVRGASWVSLVHLTWLEHLRWPPAGQIHLPQSLFDNKVLDLSCALSKAECCALLSHDKVENS
jgi:hypothetical protein